MLQTPKNRQEVVGVWFLGFEIYPKGFMPLKSVSLGWMAEIFNHLLTSSNKLQIPMLQTLKVVRKWFGNSNF